MRVRILRLTCQNYFQVDAVFAATVRTISEIVGPAESPYPQRQVTFNLERAVRGVQVTIVDVTSGMDGGDCGDSFTSGERYVVYAYRTKNGLATGICCRTRLFKEAAEDLQLIEGLPVVGTRGHVYGSITHWERNLATS